MELILTVSQLTEEIKDALENFGQVAVKGEISNYKLHSSGHRYFTLKDENAQISCTMWKSREINFIPKDGMQVVVTGILTVYPQRGNYQLECLTITPYGIGDLYLAFEALKKKLFEKGYFDVAKKKSIPTLPLSVGIATSPTGAAIKDMLSTIKRRMPAVTIYFRPTIVQGEGAEQSIISAIKELENSPAEVIIIGRGGGSIEDLWSFNLETVADAIFNCKKPIISAVGHETDFTIADFVADLRAATPTAAAEIVTPRTRTELLQYIDDLMLTMKKNAFVSIEELHNKIDFLWNKSLKQTIFDIIAQYNYRIDDLQNHIDKTTKHKLQLAKQNISYYESLINSLNPMSPLNKGYALLKYKGKYINSEESLSKYKSFEVVRDNETALAKLMQILPKKLFNKF